LFEEDWDWICASVVKQPVYAEIVFEFEKFHLVDSKSSIV